MCFNSLVLSLFTFGAEYILNLNYIVFMLQLCQKTSSLSDIPTAFRLTGHTRLIVLFDIIYKCPVEQIITIIG